MEKLLTILFVFTLEIYGSGAVFFRALEYMEGRRFRNRWIPRLAAVPVSGMVTLLTCGLMRGLSGFSAHPAAEAVAGLFVAAMLAAALSAAGVVLSVCAKKRREAARSRKKENPPRIYMRERVRRAG